LSDRVTLLPEWRPIPVQETVRRRVRCAFMTSRMEKG
jgi:hypothetical protein